MASDELACALHQRLQEWQVEHAHRFPDRAAVLTVEAKALSGVLAVSIATAALASNQPVSALAEIAFMEVVKLAQAVATDPGLQAKAAISRAGFRS